MMMTGTEINRTVMSNGNGYLIFQWRIVWTPRQQLSEMMWLMYTWFWMILRSLFFFPFYGSTLCLRKDTQARKEEQMSVRPDADWLVSKEQGVYRWLRLINVRRRLPLHIYVSLYKSKSSAVFSTGGGVREREKEEKTLGCNLTYIRWI